MSFEIQFNDQSPCSYDNSWMNDGLGINSREARSCESLPVVQGVSNGKTLKQSLLSTLRGVVTDEFHFDNSPEFQSLQRPLIVDGFNVTTLTAKDVKNMSLRAAKSLLEKIHLEGYLLKKGFRGLRMWKRRFVVLDGNTLTYYDVGFRNTS